MPSTKPSGKRFVQVISGLNRFDVFTIGFEKEKGLKSSENTVVYLSERSSELLFSTMLLISLKVGGVDTYVSLNYL